MGEETLLILTPGFPENEEDTTCLPSQQLLVRAFNRIQPDLKIVVLTLKYPFKKSDYSWFGNEVLAFHGWKEGKVNKLSTILSVWHRLRRLKKKNNVIGILSFWCTQCAWIGSYFSKMNGLTHYTWILGQDAGKENKWVRLIAPSENELIAMSDFLAKEFYKNHRIRPGHIIPNGIDTTLFGLTGQNRDIDLLAVGSLIPLKQYDLLIDVVKKMLPEYPGLRAIIAGKGPEFDRLESLIRSQGLKDHLKLLGEKSHEEVLMLMQRTRIFLHPSSYEGFSTVCLEALFSGAEVISFCNPKEQWVKHWHIVNSREDMVQRTSELLAEIQGPYESILVHSLDDVARQFIALFR